MKFFRLIICFICLSLLASAQNSHPVSWQFSAEETAPLTYRVNLRATIKSPYHIYSQQGGGGMGQPTQIIFAAHNNVTFIDEIQEKGIDQKEGEAPAHFDDGVTFSQTIKLKSAASTTIAFTIKYMACTNQMCLPPSKKEFTLAINHKEDAGAAPNSDTGDESVKKALTYETFSMTGLDGKIVAAGDVVAKARYTFIDFWASWCAPCRKQARELLPVYNKYKNKGLAVIGVSLDTDAAAWKRAITADGYTWTNLCDLKGFDSPVSKKYNITAIPRNLLIDRDGHIIAADLHGPELEETIARLFE